MKWIPGSFTKRALIAGLIAGSGIVAASSFAMTRGGPAECEARHGQADPAKWEARRAARQSELKEKLKLRADQEAAWNAYVDATAPATARPGADRQAMRESFEKLKTPQRLDRMLAMSEARRTRMLERSRAIKAFYAQLTPAQQSVFDAEFNARWPEHRRVQS
ncbi:MAG: Spy/CpxP family protein refolding chaperone [Betaproteobacteria bacterium]|nr:Spy/CpxP family protein refolding chaperone [Betaproteobacteria bacterium]